MPRTLVRVSLTLIAAAAIGCTSGGAGKAEAPPPAPTAPTAPETGGAPAAPDARPALVVFTKPGCPACLKLAPALAQIKKDYGTTWRIEEVDTSIAKKLIFEYEISLTPTLILFVGGKEHSRLLNPQPEELRAALDKAASAKS